MCTNSECKLELEWRHDFREALAKLDKEYPVAPLPEVKQRAPRANSAWNFRNVAEVLLIAFATLSGLVFGSVLLRAAFDAISEAAKESAHESYGGSNGTYGGGSGFVNTVRWLDEETPKPLGARAACQEEFVGKKVVVWCDSQAPEPCTFSMYFSDNKLQPIYIHAGGTFIWNIYGGRQYLVLSNNTLWSIVREDGTIVNDACHL